MDCLRLNSFDVPLMLSRSCRSLLRRPMIPPNCISPFVPLCWWWSSERRSGLAIYIQPNFLLTSQHLLKSPNGDRPLKIECNGQLCTWLPGRESLKEIHWDHISFLQLETNSKDQQSVFARWNRSSPDPFFVCVPTLLSIDGLADL